MRKAITRFPANNTISSRYLSYLLKMLSACVDLHLKVRTGRKYFDEILIQYRKNENKSSLQVVTVAHYNMYILASGNSIKRKKLPKSFNILKGIYLFGFVKWNYSFLNGLFEFFEKNYAECDDLREEYYRILQHHLINSLFSNSRLASPLHARLQEVSSNDDLPTDVKDFLGTENFKIIALNLEP